LSSIAREGQKESDLKIILIDQKYSVNEQEVNCIAEDNTLDHARRNKTILMQ
jgi:hypothetical protein